MLGASTRSGATKPAASYIPRPPWRRECSNVGSYDGNVYALNASTGAKLWSYSDILMGLPVVVNGVLYFGGEGKYHDGFYAFGLKTGGE